MESVVGAAAPPNEPDPEIVTPGLLGLIITLVLFAAVILLGRSLRKRLQNIDIPVPPEERPEPSAAAAVADGRREPQ